VIYRLYNYLIKFLPIELINFILYLRGIFIFLYKGNYHKPFREMKINTIIKLSSTNDLIVETGTYLGFSTMYLSKHFKDVISIELSKEVYENAKKKLKKFKNIKLYNEDSSLFLKNFFLNKNNLDISFYLDAHYMSSVDLLSNNTNPILEELEIILNNISKLRNFTIFIDDSYSYMSNKKKYESNQYLDQIYIAAKKYNLNFVISVDLIIISNKGINL